MWEWGGGGWVGAESALIENNRTRLLKSTYVAKSRIC